jgi:hypothetical protein
MRVHALCNPRSLFTVTMLLFIEGTVVKQRLMNMQELRQMGAVDEWVWVYVVIPPPACEQLGPRRKQRLCAHSPPFWTHTHNLLADRERTMCCLAFFRVTLPHGCNAH